MTNLSIAEKIALEEVFMVLDERKNKKIASIKRYFLFYKSFFKKRLLLA